MKVTVTDPQNHGEGRSMYTTYSINTASPPTSVLRRYSDFQWLYQRLLVERPGAIVPIIPHKRALSKETRVSDDFVKERRANLETFIQIVVDHPELEKAPSLTSFLTIEAGDAFDTSKKAVEKEIPNSTFQEGDHEGNAMGGKIRNMFARTAVAANVRRGKAELERTEHEGEVEEIQQYIDGLQESCKSLIAQAAMLSKASQEEALRGIGISTFGWAQAHQERFCYGSKDAMVSALGLLSTTASDSATLAHQKSVLEKEKLEASLQLLGRNIQACKIAINKRYEQSLTYTTRLSQIASRKASLDKLQATNKVLKIPKAQLDLATAEREAHAAREELEDVTTRVLREMKRVQPSLDTLLIKTFAEFATFQMEYNEKMMDAWSNVLPSLSSKAIVSAESAVSNNDDENQKEEEKTKKDIVVML